MKGNTNVTGLKLNNLPTHGGKMGAPSSNMNNVPGINLGAGGNSAQKKPEMNLPLNLNMNNQNKKKGKK